jgi:hypothetical protein
MTGELPPGAELLSCCTQVDAYAAERKLQVVGVYFASERLTDSSLSPVAARIGDKLQQRCCAQSAVFIVRPCPATGGMQPKLPSPVADLMFVQIDAQPTLSRREGLDLVHAIMGVLEGVPVQPLLVAERCCLTAGAHCAGGQSAVGAVSARGRVQPHAGATCPYTPCGLMKLKTIPISRFLTATLLLQ